MSKIALGRNLSRSQVFVPYQVRNVCQTDPHLSPMIFMTRRLEIGKKDRLSWIVVCRLWKDWRSALVIVKPETVIKWHRQGFGLYWRWKSRAKKVGRPQLEMEVR